MSENIQKWVAVEDEKAAGLLQRLYAQLQPSVLFTNEKVWKIDGMPGNRTLFFDLIWLEGILNTIVNLTDEQLSTLIAENDFESRIHNLNVHEYLKSIVQGLLYQPEKV